MILLAHKPPNSYAYVFVCKLNAPVFAVKEFEHLDWAARMRVIMGVAYCLQYMHHELSPPMAIHDVRSDTTFISDDYAAKVQLELAMLLSVTILS